MVDVCSKYDTITHINSCINILETKNKVSKFFDKRQNEMSLNKKGSKMNIPDDIGRRIGNVESLPDSIKKHISKRKNVESIESMIISVLKNLKGIGTIDEIFVNLYKDFGVIYKKTTVGTKLSLMVTNKKIKRFEGKCGVYMLNEYHEGHQ